MPYGAAARKKAKEYVTPIRKRTFCKKCGGQPIEWHHEDHLLDTNARVAHLVALGFPISRIRKEIEKCEPLCRACHMQHDGRLAALQQACPNKRGAILVGPKPCVQCRKNAKPLRRGLCNQCNHQKRAKEKL